MVLPDGQLPVGVMCPKIGVPNRSKLRRVEVSLTSARDTVWTQDASGVLLHPQRLHGRAAQRLLAYQRPGDERHGDVELRPSGISAIYAEVVMAARKKWSERSSRSRTLIVAAGAIEVFLLVATLIDIKRRPADQRERACPPTGGRHQDEARQRGLRQSGRRVGRGR